MDEQTDTDTERAGIDIALLIARAAAIAALFGTAAWFLVGYAFEV
jgi:hypothetical protein